MRSPMIDAAGLRKEPLERRREVGYDNPRRHSRIERRNHYLREINRRKEIDRHTGDRDESQHRHH